MRSMSDTQDFLFLLKTLPRDWRRVLDRRLAPLGLSQAKWQPLLYLSRADGPTTQTALANYLDIESPTLVRLLDRLADDGWIERHACPGDRRARHVCLTPRARAVCAEIEAIATEVRAQLLADVSAEELRFCVGILRRLQSRTEALLHPDDGLSSPADAAPAAAAPARKKRPATN